jgi:uncharacterized protein (DUF1501 family)
MFMTRRHFLLSTGAVAAYCGLAPWEALAGQPSAAPATQPVKQNKTLVTIFLRGGADGLNLVVPWGDPAYYELRKGLAIPRPGGASGKCAVDLDGRFGLHPRLAPLLPMFDSGHAVAIHAVGYEKNSRSHFEEQDVWETGVSGNTIGSDGWLNRHLATSQGRGPLRAVAVGDVLPRILRGKANAYAIHGVDDLAMPEARGSAGLIAAGLEHAYRIDPAGHTDAARDMINQTGLATLDGVRQLQSVAKQKYQPAATYPKTEIARRLSEVARLIKADVGLEIAQIDYDGWDTHQSQGWGSEGPFATLAGNLADALRAFMQDMGGAMENVLVMTLSDFGRTASENGTSGTDHGWANCMLAMGGGIRAASAEPRKFVGTFPGLTADKLHEKRDLVHTTDFRDVLAEVVRVHLGNPNIEKVLPGHAFRSTGLLEPRQS